MRSSIFSRNTSFLTTSVSATSVSCDKQPKMRPSLKSLQSNKEVPSLMKVAGCYWCWIWIWLNMNLWMNRFFWIRARSISKDLLDVIFGSWKVQKKKDNDWDEKSSSRPVVAKSFGIQLRGTKRSLDGPWAACFFSWSTCEARDTWPVCHYKWTCLVYVYYAQISMASQSCFRYQRCF